MLSTQCEKQPTDEITAFDCFEKECKDFLGKDYSLEKVKKLFKVTDVLLGKIWAKYKPKFQLPKDDMVELGAAYAAWADVIYQFNNEQLKKAFDLMIRKDPGEWPPTPIDFQRACNTISRTPSSHSEFKQAQLAAPRDKDYANDQCKKIFELIAKAKKK